MNRIATFAVQQLSLSQTLETQKKLFDSQIQVSSGKVSPNFLGVASESRRLVNLEGTLTAADGYIKNIDLIERRLATMEAKTAEAFDLASQFRELLVSALNAENASELALNQRASDMIQTLAGMVNVKQDDRYLFAGGRVDTPPIDLSILLATTPPLVDAAEFTGRQLQHRTTTFLTHQLNRCSGATGQLATLAWFHLNVVQQGTDTNLFQRQRIARTNISIGTGHHHITRSKTLGSKNVPLVSIVVVNQGDMSGPVGVIFDARNFTGNVEIVTLEINHTIQTLVATAAMEGSNATIVVAAT